MGRISLLLLFILSTNVIGCSNPMNSYSSNFGPMPDYRQIVLRDLQGRDQGAGKATADNQATLPARGSVFVNRSSLGRVEISGATKVLHNTRGPVWLACIRSFPVGRPSTDYAIFLKDNGIVDARTSLSLDNCASRQYSLLIIIPSVGSRSPLF